MDDTEPERVKVDCRMAKGGGRNAGRSIEMFVLVTEVQTEHREMENKRKGGGRGGRGEEREAEKW